MTEPAGPNLIVVDTAELRTVASAVQRAANGVASAAWQLPTFWAEEELTAARIELERLQAELVAIAGDLETRAAEVDSSEQRWWHIDGNRMACGCVLPSGETVTFAGTAAAASAASGPGLVPNSTGINYVTSDGRSLTAVEAAALYAAPAAGYATESLFPSYTLTPGGSIGLETPLDAQIEAGADRMAGGILGLVGQGGAGPAPSTGGLTIFEAMESGPASIPGDGNHIYLSPSGTLHAEPETDYSSHGMGETPTDSLAT
jgi:hypothetical protein